MCHLDPIIAIIAHCNQIFCISTIIIIKEIPKTDNEDQVVLTRSIDPVLTLNVGSGIVFLALTFQAIEVLNEEIC